MVGLHSLPSSEEPHVALVRRVAARSEAALEELYRAFEAPVYGLAQRILRDERAAEEAVVEVFQHVWTRAASFDPERGKPLAWVLAITRSVALEGLRARRREQAGPLALERSAELALDGPGPAAAAACGETAARVEAALRALPREQERCLRAAFFGGLSYREVADVLGQPAGTVKTRIRAGLAALRRTLAPEGDFA